MTLQDIAQKLNTLNIPVAYGGFEKSERVAMPFITYLDNYSNNFGADTSVYARIDNIQIDLFTKKKDINLENRLENVLGFTMWNKVLETSEDGYYRTTYRLQIMKGA